MVAENNEPAMDAFGFAVAGQCIRSVTHDLNNMLGSIMAYAELIQLEEQLSSESSGMLNKIVETVHHTSDLMGTLADVVRNGSGDVRPINPVQFMERILDLRRYDLRINGIELQVQTEGTPASFLCSYSKVEQALLCFINNGIEALLRHEPKDRRFRITIAEQEKGCHIFFWDSAGPISEDVAERMFEPFFTTWGKEHFGLGLPLARRIAELHGGTVSYDPGKGFILQLSQIEQKVQADASREGT